ncbi:MAG: DUF2157 domain-containing protein [Synergistaceae bacterium]|nr:DUF2157 domain-containing protein [Synergistaceae bacterium]
MERKISEAKRRFIADESNDWVSRGLITAEQRGVILDSYAVARRFPMVLVTLGIFLIGLGVLAFIAANWAFMSGWLKIMLLTGSYIASVAAACFLERKGRAVSATVLLFLSGFLLMGATAVTSQVFHTGGSLESLLLVWLVVYAPTWLLVRDISIFVMFEAVVLIYLNMEYADYGFFSRYYAENMRSLTLGPPIPAILTLAVVAAAWWGWYECVRIGKEDPESKLKYFLVGGSTRKIFFSNIAILNWVTWMCVINSRHESFLPFFLLILVIGLGIEALGWKLSASDLDLQGLLCVAVSGFALTIPFVWEFRGSPYFADPVIAPNVASSLVFAAYLVWRILRGRWWSGFTVFLFCALAAHWYFDTFYTFMSRSAFFISVGIILLATAFACFKWRKYKARPSVGASVENLPVTGAKGGADDAE